MNAEEFKLRTRRYALRVVNLVQAMPTGAVGEVLGKQLLRSGTSVGANYRAACRAKSRVDMLAKLGTVEEEADETLYWLEMIIEAGLFPAAKLSDLCQEGEEILCMIVASRKTLRAALHSQS
ncbi:MAG: four helix bundle protein [Verrucomicrobiaceae bacterium]|nr:MAG: four helix bundle protein [Verrucomicrobiaceae bacterium]